MGASILTAAGGGFDWLNLIVALGIAIVVLDAVVAIGLYEERRGPFRGWK